MKKTLLLSYLLFACLPAMFAQFSFSGRSGITVPAGGGAVYDTIATSGIVPANINGVFGFDKLNLDISYINESDLVLSLISPDGTTVHLSECYGNGADFSATCFTGNSTNMANDGSSPYSGNFAPANWMGNVNNGQVANGNWILKIENVSSGTDTGLLNNWSIVFDSTPSPPNIFDSSTLPIVVLNLGYQPIIKYVSTDVHGLMGIISNSSGINRIGDPFNEYHGHIKIHARGSSSQWFAALSYAVGTTDAAASDSDVSLLGMPADHSWILYQPFDDKALMRNVLTFKISNEMGDYAVRTRFVELVLDGDYRGVYVLMERISRGSSRVAVSKLNTTDTALPTITGGYIFSVDKGADASNSFPSSVLPCPTAPTPVYYQYVNPKSSDINTQQKAYLQAYLDSFDRQVDMGNLYDTLHGYRHFIDVRSFMDQSILQEVGRNVDGYRISTYFHKPRNGKVFGGPIWDFNLAYGNADYYDGWLTSGWQMDMLCPSPYGDPYYVPFWYRKWMASDTVYLHELKCRYTLLRHDVLDTVHINHLIDSFAHLVNVPQNRHYTRWPIMGRYVWPNYYIGSSYADEVHYMKNWLHDRILFMDSMLLDTSCHAPVSHVGLSTPVMQKVSVRPNPAIDELWIECGNEFSAATITNCIGQSMLHSNLSAGSNRLDVNTLSQGIYFIKLTGPGRSYISRFVKVN